MVWTPVTLSTSMTPSFMVYSRAKSVLLNFCHPTTNIKEDINTVINSWELFIRKVFAPETIADMWPRVLHIDFGKVYYPAEWWSICRSDVHWICWLSLQYAFQLDAESH